MAFLVPKLNVGMEKHGCVGKERIVEAGEESDRVRDKEGEGEREKRGKMAMIY